MFSDTHVDRKTTTLDKKINAAYVEIEVTTGGDWRVMIGDGHLGGFSGAGDVPFLHLCAFTCIYIFGYSERFLWTFWVFIVKGWPVHCRFSSIPDLYPLDESNILQAVRTKMSLDISKCHVEKKVTPHHSLRTIDNQWMQDTEGVESMSGGGSGGNGK